MSKHEQILPEAVNRGLNVLFRKTGCKGVPTGVCVEEKKKICISYILAGFVSYVLHFQAHAEVSQWSAAGKAKRLPFFSPNKWRNYEVALRQQYLVMSPGASRERVRSRRVGGGNGAI